jgi:eukaryotic translation initiation factor 2C
MILGHVKPTYNTIVYDESSLTADEIQTGTHNASWLYARAMKAVCLVAVTGILCRFGV